MLFAAGLISGLIFADLGVIFLRYQGTAGLTGLLSPPSLDGWTTGSRKPSQLSRHTSPTWRCSPRRRPR
jgi:hypothetical protein